MKLTLKNITRTLTLGALASVAAFAASYPTGTLTIGGTVPASFSMTQTGNTTQFTNGNLTFSSLTVANVGDLVIASPVSIDIRCNKSFTLTATMTDWFAGVDDGGFNITPSDIGFGITAKSAAADAITRTAADVMGHFDYANATTFTNLKSTTGHSPFGAAHATLADVVGTTGAAVLTGPRISKNGNIMATDNSMTLTFNAAILPQYFTPVGFSGTITLTPSMP